MFRDQFTPTMLAAGLALSGVGAASAHDPAAPPPGESQVFCPAAPPAAPRPAAHVRHAACGGRHAHLARDHGWRRPVHHVAVARVTTRDDVGVAPTQAWVYRQELAGHGLAAGDRPRRDRDVRPWVQAPPPPPVVAQGGDRRGAEDWRGGDRDHYRAPPPPAAPPPAYAQGGERRVEIWRGESHSGSCCAPPPPPGRVAAGVCGYGGASGGQYSYERQEFGARSSCAEDMTDGHRHGWSWRRDGGVPPWRYARGGGYEVYGYAGRDDDGYLVWADKPR